MNGNCFICGKEFTKEEIIEHIASHNEGEEECFVLLVECPEFSDYWVFADIATHKPLSALDTFLRRIWLECCAHDSEFNNEDGVKIGKARKISEFSVGDTINYTYDFEIMTELTIKILAKINRPKQTKAIRLLARNIAPKFQCMDCLAPATEICCECGGVYKSAYFCDDCIKNHAHFYILPITNSPRQGMCKYLGEQDDYKFDPFKYYKRNTRSNW